MIKGISFSQEAVIIYFTRISSPFAIFEFVQPAAKNDLDNKS